MGREEMLLGQVNMTDSKQRAHPSHVPSVSTSTVGLAPSLSRLPPLSHRPHAVKSLYYAVSCAMSNIPLGMMPLHPLVRFVSVCPGLAESFRVPRPKAPMFSTGRLCTSCLSSSSVFCISGAGHGFWSDCCHHHINSP